MKLVKPCFAFLSDSVTGNECDRFWSQWDDDAFHQLSGASVAMERISKSHL